MDPMMCLCVEDEGITMFDNCSWGFVWRRIGWSHSDVESWLHQTLPNHHCLAVLFEKSHSIIVLFQYTPEDWRLEHNSLEVWFQPLIFKGVQSIVVPLVPPCFLQTIHRFNDNLVTKSVAEVPDWLLGGCFVPQLTVAGRWLDIS